MIGRAIYGASDPVEAAKQLIGNNRCMLACARDRCKFQWHILHFEFMERMFETVCHGEYSIVPADETRQLKMKTR